MNTAVEIKGHAGQATEYVMCTSCRTEPATFHEPELLGSFESGGVHHEATIKLPSVMCEGCFTQYITATAPALVQRSVYHATLDAARKAKRPPARCASCSVAVER